ncbi:MAG: hypothetical protein HQ478_01420 [Chloroflexi bacterium]|nr:hypothetical protein [Chloroflexota bacterium]
MLDAKHIAREGEIQFEDNPLPILADRNNQLVGSLVRVIRDSESNPTINMKTIKSDMNIAGLT